METQSGKLITPEDYAIRENVSLKTVYNRIKAGKLETEKIFKKTLIKE
jgi:hypothetical protein